MQKEDLLVLSHSQPLTWRGELNGQNGQQEFPEYVTRTPHVKNDVSQCPSMGCPKISWACWQGCRHMFQICDMRFCQD